MNGTRVPRRKYPRSPGYDYSMSGGYFITSCTWNHQPLFENFNEKFLVTAAWNELLMIFVNIELGEFVVVPNHVHGIIWITENGAYRLHPSTWNSTGGQLPARTIVRSGGSESPEIKLVTLSNTVGAFKTNAAKKINRFRGRTGERVWQRSYYERVIRNEKEAERIQEYIRMNPESLAYEDWIT